MAHNLLQSRINYMPNKSVLQIKDNMLCNKSMTLKITLRSKIRDYKYNTTCLSILIIFKSILTCLFLFKFSALSDWAMFNLLTCSHWSWLEWKPLTRSIVTHELKNTLNHKENARFPLHFIMLKYLANGTTSAEGNCSPVVG